MVGFYIYFLYIARVEIAKYFLRANAVLESGSDLPGELPCDGTASPAAVRAVPARLLPPLSAALAPLGALRLTEGKSWGAQSISDCPGMGNLSGLEDGAKIVWNKLLGFFKAVSGGSPTTCLYLMQKCFGLDARTD